MKKKINRFLNKKSDFTQNEELRGLNDYLFWLLGEEKKVLNYALWENIKYFLEHKKLYLVKLFLVLMMFLGVFGGVILAGVFTLDYFNIISISRPKIVEIKKMNIFLPDTAIASIYKVNTDPYLRKYYQVVIYFLPDLKKDWKQYKEAIHNIESRGPDDKSYWARDGEYWGRYQLGELAREISGLGKMTFEEFASNPELQEGAFLAWVRYLKDQSKKLGLTRFYGKYIDGVQMTESGVISMCHNAGTGATQAYLLRGGENPPGSLQFIKIGGYNLNLD